MNIIVKSYLLIFANVLLGLGILLLSDSIRLPLWINKSALILVALVILNVICDSFFKLNTIATYWSVKRIYYLLPAAATGAVIAALPSLFALLFGIIKQSDVQLSVSTSWLAVIILLIIVGWEEIWFRGVILNYANKHLSAINLSITIGLLFMGMHVLNPEIELLKKGPALFFAGALLTILYFYYRSIWVPWGVHFGNNFFGDMIKSKSDHDLFFGSDGYLSAIILALVFLFFAYRIYTKRSAFSVNA